MLKYDDTTYTRYYADVGKHDILTITEEQELFQRYHTCTKCSSTIPLRRQRTVCPGCGVALPSKMLKGTVTCTKCLAKFEPHVFSDRCACCGTVRDKAAREKIILSNLRFVIKRAQALTRDPKRRNVLISAGNVGLMLAIDKYSPDRGTRFLTYAEWWIRKEMYDAINSSPLIHIPPQKRRALLKQIQEGKYVCVYCGAHSLFRDDHFASKCVAEAHVFEPVQVESNGLLGNGVPLEHNTLTEESGEEDVLAGGVATRVRDVLRKMNLSERDRYIILGYYDVAQPDRKADPKNLGQLAALLGITPERVRQLKKSALEKVKKELSRQSLKPEFIL